MSIREIKTHRSHKHRQLQIILTVVSITENKNQILLSIISIPVFILVVYKKI